MIFSELIFFLIVIYRTTKIDIIVILFSCFIFYSAIMNFNFLKSTFFFIQQNVYFIQAENKYMYSILQGEDYKWNQVIFFRTARYVGCFRSKPFLNGIYMYMPMYTWARSPGESKIVRVNFKFSKGFCDKCHF